MKIGVISIFPEMFSALNYGIVGRAIGRGLASVQHWDPRDFTEDKHRTVDDRPYGGGPGMVMQVGPLQRAIQAARSSLPEAQVIHLSPQGKRLDQAAIQAFSKRKGFILLAGRYEGIDERLIEAHVDEEWSIGDYILTGGELAAMVLIDATLRLLPGALGDDASAVQESFTTGLLDYPHYTRPEKSEGVEVPSVLLSGDHRAILRWRMKQALGRTWLRRPDLLEKVSMSDSEKSLLNEFMNEYSKKEKHHA